MGKNKGKKSQNTGKKSQNAGSNNSKVRKIVY